MARILPFIRPEMAFNPEDTAVLVTAYEKAIKQLRGDGFTELVREIIAKRIIDAALKGERDPDRLCASAIASIGFPGWIDMAEYRIFTLTKERRIAGPAEVIDCASDKHAVEEAKILMNDHDMEIWQGSRMVMRLRPHGWAVTCSSLTRLDHCLCFLVQCGVISIEP